MCDNEISYSQTIDYDYADIVLSIILTVYDKL